MYEIGVTAQFEAAHRLVGDFGPATRMHGHSYRIEAAVRGPRLRPDGTLLDISLLQSALAALVGELHYRDLDEVPGLGDANTTAENVAAFCWQRLAAAMRPHPEAERLAVRVWENPGIYAAFEDTL